MTELSDMPEQELTEALKGFLRHHQIFESFFVLK